jgi:PAS domain S-box-containing protein
MQRRGVSGQPGKTQRTSKPKVRRASTAARASPNTEERYRLVVEAVAEGIYEWSTDTNHLELSSRLNEMLGFEKGELTSGSWVEHVHPDDRGHYRDATIAHFKGVVPRGILRTREGDIYPVAATYRLTEQQRDRFTRYSTKPDRGSLFGRAILEGRTIHVSDVLADPEYDRSRQRDLVTVRAGLAVPMMREGTVVGVVTLQRKEPRPFSDSQIQLVTTFADQAVIAIENVRLFDEVQARTRELSESLEQQTATSEVLKVISRSPGELEPVFNAMLANAIRICEATFGNLFLGEGPIFRSVTIHSKQQSHVDSWRRNPIIDLRNNPGLPLDRVANTKQVVHIPDLRADQSYLGKNDRMVTLVEVAGARTSLIVPMLTEGQLIGAINMYRQEVFTDK